MALERGDAEATALLKWLPQVPAAERVRVERAGSRFAINTGPFHAWRRFCEGMLADNLDDAARSDVLWTLGQVALRGDDPDRALAAAEEKRDLDRNRGAEREVALAAELIRRHPARPRAAGRGAAHPQGGGTAGLRAPRRRAFATGRARKPGAPASHAQPVQRPRRSAAPALPGARRCAPHAAAGGAADRGHPARAPPELR